MRTRKANPEDEMRYTILKYTSQNWATIKYEAHKFYENKCKFPTKESGDRHAAACYAWGKEVIDAGFYLDHRYGLRVILVW